MNYTLQEYANDVVYRIASVCNARGIPHPMIVSESGRAIAAHHSVLVFNTLGASALDELAPRDRRGPTAEATSPCRSPSRTCSTPTAASANAAWSSATTTRPQAREQALQMFNLGYLSLEQRGLAERLFWAICAKIRDFCRASSTRCPRSSKASRRSSPTPTSATSRCSSRCPDSWAIDQLFPIMPIHRLGRAADAPRRARRHHLRLGRQDRPLRQPRDVKRTLELHESPTASEYYLGVFLVGAYQETSATCTTCSATRTSCTAPSLGPRGSALALFHPPTGARGAYPGTASLRTRALSPPTDARGALPGTARLRTRALSPPTGRTGRVPLGTARLRTRALSPPLAHGARTLGPRVSALALFHPPTGARGAYPGTARLRTRALSPPTGARGAYPGTARLRTRAH
jgi:hypothetical protein